MSKMKKDEWIRGVIACALLGTLPAGALETPETSRLFEKRVDPVSGIVSYALSEGERRNCQSLYFTAKSMTDDDRYVISTANNADGHMELYVTPVDQLKSAVRTVVTSSFAAVCNCAVCPERENDFVWENDKFGMRAYGPGEYHKWSGFDVFNKNTSSNVCLNWCHRLDKSINFHHNYGYGMDNYTMGASRGVGGVAMFADGEWKTYPDWEESRVLHTGDDYLQFELVYPAFSSAGRMTCRITLRRGERFFRNDVRFERKPPPGTFVGPGLDLEPKRDHKGNLHEEPGLVSLFEDPKGKDGAEGSTMEAVFVADPSAVTNLTDRMNCRVLAFRDAREFTYWAGASWSLAGEITTAAAWHAAVKAARENGLFYHAPDVPFVWGRARDAQGISRALRPARRLRQHFRRLHRDEQEERSRLLPRARPHPGRSPRSGPDALAHGRAGVFRDIGIGGDGVRGFDPSLTDAGCERCRRQEKYDIMRFANSQLPIDCLRTGG